MEERAYWEKNRRERRLMARRLSRRRLLQGVAGTGLLLAVGAACRDENPSTSTGTGKSGTPKQGGTLGMAMAVDLEGLDPHATTGTAVMRIFHAGIYDPLIRYNPEDLSLEPGLAVSWETPEPTTVLLKLRQGVMFHDGSTLDADVVKYNIERVLDPATRAKDRAAMTVVTRVEAADPQTVRLTLSRPSASLLALLGDRPGLMVSRAAAETGTLMDKPVGTGPFQFVEWVKGSSASFRRFEGYWEQDAQGNTLPYLDGIQVRVIPDEEQQFNALVSSTVQMMEVGSAGVGGQYIDRIQGDGNLQFVGGETRAFKSILLNLAWPPLDNVDLRRAIAYGVNRKAIGDAVYFSHATVATGPATPRDWAYDPAIQGYEYDPKKAKDLLAKAGMPNGFTFPGLVSTTPDLNQVAVAVKAQLAEIGINFDYQVGDRSQILDTVYSKGQTGATISGSEGRADFGQLASTYFSSNGSFMIAHYREGWQPPIPEIDRLIADAEATYDLEERKELYSRLQQLVVDNVYGHVFLVYPETGFGLRKNVQNFTFYGDNYPRLHRVWLA